MKKRILKFVLITVTIGSITASCGSSKKASGSDTTKMKDTMQMTKPPSAMQDSLKRDSIKKDSMKRDTTHH